MSSILSISSVFQYIGYIFVAILVLLLMVLIHELGHYTFGKILKFKINEFSIGFGPKLFQKTKKNGEKVTLRLLPLGGYCAFEGEDEENPNNPDAFNNQKPWKRLIVLLGGVLFNFLSAIIFSFIVLLSVGYDYVKVDKISADYSINRTCFETGDVIYGVGNKQIDFVNDDYFSNLITDYVIENYKTYSGEDITGEYSYIDDGKTYYMSNEQLTYIIKRDGKFKDVSGYVNVIYDSTGKYVGWSLLSTENDDSQEFVLSTYKYSFGEALIQSVPFSFKWAWKVLVVFGKLITGNLDIRSIGGPVTTIKTIANYTQTSFNYLLLLLPIIAVNLAVFNILPIPALDGFQIIFVFIEMIRKKPVKRQVVNLINNIGLLFLLGFVIIVDILQFVL